MRRWALPVLVSVGLHAWLLSRRTPVERARGTQGQPLTWIESGGESGATTQSAPAAIPLEKTSAPSAPKAKAHAPATGSVRHSPEVGEGGEEGAAEQSTQGRYFGVNSLSEWPRPEHPWEGDSLDAGAMLIQLTVTASGRVEGVIADDPSLRVVPAEIIVALKHRFFEPARVQGLPVSTTVPLWLRFSTADDAGLRWEVSGDGWRLQ